jgi:hypothetical protein
MLKYNIYNQDTTEEQAISQMEDMPDSSLARDVGTMATHGSFYSQ